MTNSHLFEVKSKFDAEFRRISVDPSAVAKFEDFYRLLERLHQLHTIPFVVQYVDPKNADLLPINNDKNYEVALTVSRPLLRILLQRKGESYGELYGYKASKSNRLHKSAASALRSFGNSDKWKPPDRPISIQSDFHLVSSILDVNIIPRELRRVRLVRTPNKQFGLYIRNGVSHHHTVNGYETVPAFFVSRLDRDGIAYGTGLLAEDDEIIEVNGIEVFGKTMDQVTDMMVANSSNLIITVRPADQRTCLPPSTNPTSPAARSARTLPTSAYQLSPHSIDRPSSLLQLANERNSAITLPHGLSQSRPIQPSTHSTTHHTSTDGEEETDDDITAGLITL
ncbi:hypothetical protein AHF37_08746 [Paragonimus kellicotti]|nr:hypothetical protein AHF37_08746 [Paragonimus kellicotti]